MSKCLEPINPDYKLKNYIREYREESGYTQEELGKICGITGESIHRYEKGIASPSAFHAYKICFALDVPFDVLFYLD